MGKRAKNMKRLKHDSETSSSPDKEEPKMIMRVADAGDDDDCDDNVEANEDLSLKIIEKAMQRQQNANQDDAAMDDGIAMITELRACNDNELKKKKKKNNTKKKSKEKEELSGSDLCDLDTNFKSFCGELFLEEQKEESEKVSEIDVIPASTDPVESSDNSVFRRLLRGPRYFDPPDSNWGTCYNCGEEGHVAVNCTAAKRVKPCFVCGSLDHNVKNCAKRKDCYICKKGGHIAKDCPGKNSGEPHTEKMCLKCGVAGHDMFSCRSSYCADDLKEIQCYVCRKFGHLCCVEYTDRGPAEISCYRCGQLGHTGLACIGFRTETSGAGTLSSCYRCGEEGHFARECASSTKVSKRNREPSTPKKNRYKENDYEARSVPNDLGKARKKKFHYDEGFTSASKSKHRGGWGTEDPGDFQEHGGWHGSAYTSKHRGGWTADDPGDFYDSGYKANGWRSPVTPNNWKTKNYGYAENNYSSSPSKRVQHHNFSNSGSYGSSKNYHHGFSASRFGNNNSDVSRRYYHW
ncbi:hypothetical protein LIER_02821 [Lithospermum erythrorhizon]|uniref:CCHC-type domain-containing protein n=1 Tax=Lithospermum erythrorhizon TaxID=34254 RepID=A0AAV3NRJ9_LITER